jgi:protoporphyrin/coproporphyrin ferrochelatase
MKSGLLIINLGTPAALNLTAVKRYLSEFLSDKRVIDLPWIIRFFLVHGLIIPFRAKKSLHAYTTIWSEQGSPLLSHSQQLVKQIQKEVNDDIKVLLAMRYGAPSIQAGLEELQSCSSITILPLYPQYSSAANGSSIEKTIQLIKGQEVIPSLKIISNFYQHPSYIQAQAEFIKMHFNPKSHLLFSYHGIPERQIHKSGCKKLCLHNCSTKNSNCYRAQCYQTSNLIAQTLNLSTDQHSTSFQSRLGRTPWIKPYTDELLKTLAEQGIKHLTITCPSFVTDCLETLEEIGIRAREQWLQLGGEQFTLIPSMNDYSSWAKAILKIAEI